MAFHSTRHRHCPKTVPKCLKSDHSENNSDPGNFLDPCSADVSEWWAVLGSNQWPLPCEGNLSVFRHLALFTYIIEIYRYRIPSYTLVQARLCYTFPYNFRTERLCQESIPSAEETPSRHGAS